MIGVATCNVGAAAEKEARYCFCRGMGRPRYRQGCSALPGNVHQEAGPSGPRSRGQIQDCGPSFNSLNTLLKRVKLEVADWGTGLLSTKVEDCGGGHVPLSDPSYTPLHVQFSFWWQQVVDHCQGSNTNFQSCSPSVVVHCCTLSLWHLGSEMIITEIQISIQRSSGWAIN